MYVNYHESGCFSNQGMHLPSDKPNYYNAMKIQLLWSALYMHTHTTHDYIMLFCHFELLCNYAMGQILCVPVYS